MSVAGIESDEAPKTPKGKKGKTMAGPRPGTREREFAKRLTQALDSHPRCPAAYGRLTWVTRELAHHKVDVTIETVRQWLAGKMMPRRITMAALAKTLMVDETWPAMGPQSVAKSSAAAKAEALESLIQQIEMVTTDEKVLQMIERHRKLS